MIVVSNGVSIMASVFDIIELLSRQLHSENIPLLQHIVYPKYEKQNIMCTCIAHKGGVEHKPSMGIMTAPKDKSNKLFVHCFACGYSATIESFISRCFGIYDTGAFGTQWLLDNFGFYDVVNRSKAFCKLERTTPIVHKPTYIQDGILSDYRWYHPYMYKRYLTDAIIDKFDIGFNRITNSVTIPVRDLAGGVVFVAERSVVDKRFHYPAGVQKPVYGLYESNQLFTSNTLYICESFFNALMFIKWGQPAVALMGTGTSYQYEILRKSHYRHLIICTDNDEAGEIGANKLYNALHSYKFISRLKTKKNTDVNDWGYLNSLEEFLSLAVDNVETT